MQLRKITKKEYEHNNAPVQKKPTIKVFNGKIKIEDSFLKIPAGSYKWFVLIPKELVSDINWIHVFRQAHKGKAIRELTNGQVIQNLVYDTFDLTNESVLFAFK